jgi:hypothetical protein
MNPPHDPSQRIAERQTALDVSRGDRDRALDAMHALEAASATAGPGREQEWRNAVVSALEHLTGAIAEQHASYEHPESLMAQLAQDDPRLRTWVRQLHHRWSGLASATRDLALDLRDAHAAGFRSIDDIREQVRWLSAALQHHRAREADLIFQALGVDMSAASERPSDAATADGEEHQDSRRRSGREHGARPRVRLHIDRA